MKNEEGGANLDSLGEIELAIDSLKPQELAEFHAWLKRYHPSDSMQSDATVSKQGVGLFGGSGNAALMDEVVELAYEETQCAARLSVTL